MTKQFMYWQTVLQYRIPYDEMGIPCGQPEILKKFTVPYKDSVSKKPKAKQITLDEETSEVLF